MPTPRARRSCHVVPGTSPRMLAKAAELDADEVILDLEDSVTDARKGDEARRAVAGALDGPMRAPLMAVRVNPVGSPHFAGDIAAVVAGAGRPPAVVVLPKVEDAAQIRAAHDELSAAEAARGAPACSVGIEAQIETARGLVNVEAIASACPDRMEALVFGPGDMAASLGMPQTSIGGPVAGYPGDGWHHVLGRIVVAARAFGLAAVDGPYALIHDTAGLAASAARSRALGYDGKWSIHPAQLATLNEVYGVAAADLAQARRVLEAYDAARAAGAGAAMLDGEMIDEATRLMAAGVVERARLTGAG